MKGNFGYAKFQFSSFHLYMGSFESTDEGLKHYGQLVQVVGASRYIITVDGEFPREVERAAFGVRSLVSFLINVDKLSIASIDALCCTVDAG